MELMREIEELQKAASAPLDQEEQMELVDSLEKVLQSVGVNLQPRFEIALTSRVIHGPVNQPA